MTREMIESLVLGYIIIVVGLSLWSLISWVELGDKKPVLKSIAITVACGIILLRLCCPVEAIAIYEWIYEVILSPQSLVIITSALVISTIYYFAKPLIHKWKQRLHNEKIEQELRLLQRETALNELIEKIFQKKSKRIRIKLNRTNNWSIENIHDVTTALAEDFINKTYQQEISEIYVDMIDEDLKSKYVEMLRGDGANESKTIS